MAGTGKSTISRTVAQIRHGRGDLGATFFFKRGEVDRGSLIRLVPTLARHLASRVPGVAPIIKRTIDENPEIIVGTIRDQFRGLIFEPLAEMAATRTTPSPLVVVVDALDECERDADIKLLLGLLSDMPSSAALYVRVLVTSRPELPVRLGFCSIDGTYQSLELHEIAERIITSDISLFLCHEFTKIRNTFNSLAEEAVRLPLDWPGEATLVKLTLAASPLFIFAATICRFINDPFLGDPEELLQKVVDTTSNVHTSQLVKTYSPILEQQIIGRSDREKSEIIDSFRLIVGTIIVLADPLSKQALAALLGIDIRKVTTRLGSLNSVLNNPESLHSPVRLLHLSFRDYLVTEKTEFWIDQTLANCTLATSCMRIMREGLKANICGLKFAGFPRSEVSSETVEQCIPSELQYACLYWVHHQISTKHDSDYDPEISLFLEKTFLNWLEVMSLIGQSGDILGKLELLASWLKVTTKCTLNLFLANPK